MTLAILLNLRQALLGGGCESILRLESLPAAIAVDLPVLGIMAYPMWWGVRGS
jgi:hypothetical protein